MANSSGSRTRLALPKGKMLANTAAYLNAVGLGFDDYNSRTRIYRMQSPNIPSITAKMLNERDIPVQVAVGNYDFGICSSDWLQELQAHYPASQVFKLVDLDFDKSSIFLAAPLSSTVSPEKMTATGINWRIVTEYPALAQAAAHKMRLKRFSVFPVWGSAEAYPPENADFAVLKAVNESALAGMNLKSVRKICDSSACIIANSACLQTTDFSTVLSRFTSALNLKWPHQYEAVPTLKNDYVAGQDDDGIWLALADGHQQAHTSAFLEKTRLKIRGYSKDDLRRRPSSNLGWLNIKVVRPQDMPQQVANGNFDLAVTGRDWLLDHLYQFPSSPVMELVDLAFGWVKVVAVVSQDISTDSIEGIRELLAAGKMVPLRIATEYVNIADKYLRDRHIARYRVIPTWGATEVYLPEDADMLIENTETGQTLARHKLKIIDTLFESTACLIGSRKSLEDPLKKNRINRLIKLFREAADLK